MGDATKRSSWNLIKCLLGMKRVSGFSFLSPLLRLSQALGLFADSDCDNDDSILSKELSFDVPD